MATTMRIVSNRLLSRTIQDLSCKAAVQRLCTVHQSTKTPHIWMTPAAFLHSSQIYSTYCTSLPSSSSVSVTEEPDTLFQKLTVLVKGHDKAVLDSYEFFVTLAAKELGLTLTKVFEPPKNIERLTLLKSVHIFKKHRVQYEMRTHYRCIEISRVTGSTAQVYLEYIQRCLPEGMAMEVTKTAIEKVPEHIKMPLWCDQSKDEQTNQ